LALTPGTRLGVYEITALLGEGGMGQVYRATDTKLKRQVAIKILPPSLAADSDRLARFQREAEVLASLNHPNIAHIHGLEESGGMTALVMELVEGEDLSQRIARGAIPIDEALPIAKQIAEALEAAHEQGIIHRDLKPANIKVRPDGTVKVLDFGLAKAMEPAAGSSPSASMSPTITTPAMMTGVGMILGTAAYMSPEQAKGREADKRSDIWAFGAVLYEMLSGKPVFGGTTTVEILSEVLKSEPDWKRLPPSTPEGIRRLLRRCLEKDWKERLRHVGDARIEIRDAQSGPEINSQLRPNVSRSRERLAWASAALLFATVAGLAVVWPRQPAPAPLEARLEISTPSTSDPSSFAISPDAKTIVFVATSQGQLQLWLRSLDSVSTRPLAGTDGASLPFWSPDSQSIGFFAEGKLKRIDIDSGSVQPLAEAPIGQGGTWSRDGVILFSPFPPLSVFRVSAAGGEVIPQTHVVPPQQGHNSPHFLPDGRHFLYFVRGSPEVRGIYVGQIDEPISRRLRDADSGAVYVRPGHLLFVREGTIFAQPFDLDRLQFTGDPFLLAEQATPGAPGPPAASAVGPIAYRTGAGQPVRQFLWVDRSGTELQRVGEPGADLNAPALSHDGKRVALFRGVGGNVDIWSLDVERGGLDRLTSDPADDTFPIWSPDDKRILFSSNRKGVGDLYLKLVADVGSERLLLTTPQLKMPNDWSADGRFVLYSSFDRRSKADLWGLRLEDPSKPFVVAQTDGSNAWGQFSPDGQWIAHTSNESGRWEVYIRPFPPTGGKSLISTNGGVMPRWRPDGKELFYVALDDRLMAVPIRKNLEKHMLEAGAPVALFATRIGGARAQAMLGQYEVAPDGQRFLMNSLAGDVTAPPITIIMNWRPKP
jgi:eukaryotic-like serine/threonine-protein kinase